MAQAMTVEVKRAYEKASLSDGARVLVERLWPRGVSKQRAKLDLWLRDLAPSTQLRKWYHARPTQWPAFRKKYLEELHQPAASAALEQLYDLAQTRNKVTLVYGSRDEQHNCAVILKELLEGMRKPPASSGPAAAAAQGRARAARRR
jgi:uncharacterized protein YeaO (DUF488 family)